MKNYQLELRQIVDYPRCRIYREFIQTLIADRGIRTGGCSGLFYYVVLCAYVNFRTSYRRIDGISYTVYPGEWVCSITDIAEWFRVRFHYQAFAILKSLQDRQLITFTRLGRGHIVKFSITDWRRNNTALDYNCPCQKDSGFFFIPVSTATELISAGRASEMDALLDLWISAIYKDQQVRGSEIGPVAYFRNGTGNPLVNYTELSARWGISRSSVGRILKKLSELDHLSLLTFPGRSGTVIYLKNYLSTMFQISDVMIDKEEVAMCLNLRVSVPDTTPPEASTISDEQISVSTGLSSVSKPHITANGLCGGVGQIKSRFLFQRAQFIKKRVIFGIRQRRRVEIVVFIPASVQPVGQFPYSLLLALLHSLGILDLRKPLFRNAANLKKPVWLMLQYFQGIDTKLFNDRVGGLLSDTFQQTGGKIIADALQCGRHDLLPMIDLKLKSVFSVLPLSIHLDLHRIRLRQFDANGGKADQVVVIAIGAPGFCGYAAVLRFHPKNRIFAGRIEKQYLVQCCNNAHNTSPPFLFTLPAKQLFSHGIFAIQTP